MCVYLYIFILIFIYIYTQWKRRRKNWRRMRSAGKGRVVGGVEGVGVGGPAAAGGGVCGGMYM
jgi:hypothetical protein